jgi:branched-subunit amino acid transport protein AzlD
MPLRRLRLPLATLIAVGGVFAAVGAAKAGANLPADPADQPPFDGGRTYRLAVPPSESRPPPGFTLSARRAEAIAAEAVSGDLPSELGRVRVRTRLGSDGRNQWQIDFFEQDGTDVAEVVIDDAGKDVVERWTGAQVGTKLARGYQGAVAGKVNRWWIWLPLCVLFLAPFVDPRRPLRLVHLDLLALLAFSVSLFFFNKAEIGWSVGLVYPVLAYVFVRMLIAGFRPVERRDRLLPIARPGWLVAGIVALAAFHTAYIATEGKVIDVGLAGAIGADRIARGEELYGPGFSERLPPNSDVRGDVYGPVNYLAYVPFEAAFPWSGRWDDVSGARAAALGFELLTALALYLLGCRIRTPRGIRWWEGDTIRAQPHGSTAEGRTLGIALAYAWLAYPFTIYTLGSSFNDALVALLVVCCLLVLASPPARGAASALAGLTKFGPLALAPLLAAGHGDRRPRPLIAFAVSFLLIAAVVTIPLLPDGGFRELYDRSLGYQASRGSPFSVWGQAPSLDFLQTLSKALAVALAALLFFVPWRRTTVQVAALAAALLIAVQVTANHWFYPYTVWFAPLVLVAVFAAQREIGPAVRARHKATARHV